MFSRFKPKSEFSRNVLTLMTGTIIAQAIPIAISPILTRIYTPKDFGIFALYMGIASIISVVATGRYEMAIMLPKEDEDVKSLVKLILLLLGFISFLSFIFVFLFNEQITNLFDNKDISNWLYFLPISIFLVGIYQVYNYLLIREKNFKRLATNKIIVSSTNASTQVGLGLTLASSFGLLLGNIFGYIVSIYFIIKSKVVNSYFQFKNLPIKNVAKEYQKFPKYDVPSVLLNVVANQLPILTIGKFFGLGVLGLYALMYKVLMMPINLLSGTILDVFKQRATEDFNKYGNCKDIYIKTFKKLILLGIVPFSIIGLYAQELFAFIFGEEWRKAGEFAQIMAPMLFLKFVINPLSYTFYVAQKQHVDFAGQIFLFILILLAMYLGIEANNINSLLMFFTNMSIIIYIIYLYLSYQYSKGL